MRRAVAALLLLMTTFFWGVTFTVVKEAIAQVDVFVFLAQRFVLAVAVMLPFALVRWRALTRRALVSGVLMGIFLFASYGFQTVALQWTSACNTAFLTGLNVVLVPVLGGLFLGHRIGRCAAGGVLLALAGLYLLCDGGALGLNRGDLLAAICGVCVSLHLLLTGMFAGENDVWWLTIIQLGTVALLSLATSLLRGLPVLVSYPAMVPTLTVCVLFATVLAFLVQTTMQRRLSATHTALIFCTEPVFAALYAYFAAGERLAPAGMQGALLIVAGMVLSQMGGGEEEMPKLEPAAGQ